ncbi:MAG: DUF3052 domain-containing protein [Chloroflexota bacterium]
MRVALLNPPEDYPIPDGVEQFDLPATSLDFIHLFAARLAELETVFPELKAALAPAGMLWISWYKKSAKIPTDLDENLIREIGLVGGLVDVKVAAVDDLWSGLKFVYRLKDRA